MIEWFKNLFVPVEMTAQELSGFAAAGKAVGKAIGGKFLLAAAVPELNACRTYSPSRLAAKNGIELIPDRWDGWVGGWLQDSYSGVFPIGDVNSACGVDCHVPRAV